MKATRAWKFRLYPSKAQEKQFYQYLHICKNLWNHLLDYTKKYYKETGRFPTRKELYFQTKETLLFSQVAQNVADRLVKSIRGMISKKRAGKKAGFARFKPIERMRSFTYPQFGFRVNEKLDLSGIGPVSIKKHRALKGMVKTLTIKKSPSGKWFAIFTTEAEVSAGKNDGPKAGIDLGVENFAYLSDGVIVENPRHLKTAEQKLKIAQRQLSHKANVSQNRKKARLKVAIAHERLANRRRDFLHKTSRKLVNNYSLIALENLNVAGLAKGFLAKEVLDCSWAEFSSMLTYKAEEAGCEIVLVNPAYTTQMCSSCSLVQKKSLAERWHSCSCGASIHRDLNAAINILNRATNGTTNRSIDSSFGATAGIAGSNACEESIPTGNNSCQQISSLKQETHAIDRRNGQCAP
jgi:putative transposase